jgi:DNA-binding NarL/FixJ family response regulator
MTSLPVVMADTVTVPGHPAWVSATSTTARVHVTVEAPDPISRLGAVCALGQHPELELDPAPRPGTVAVLFTDSPDTTTIERLTAIGGLRIVLVAGGPDAGVLKAVEHGVQVILWRREATGQRLLQAVLAAARGESCLPADLGERLLPQLARQHREEKCLGPREVAVIRLVAEGLNNETIALRLSYSQRTIKKVLFDVKTRLDLHNRAHAVAYAFRHGYL